MRFSTLIFTLPVLLLFSCNGDVKAPAADSVVSADTLPEKMPPTNRMDFHAGMNVECKTFAITDSVSSATHGWGYDLYVGDKKIIHQSMMPAVGGICAFMSESDAMKMGSLAAHRFGATGNFPTIYVEDYDSLKIQLPPALQKQVDSLIIVDKQRKANGK